MGYLIIFIIFIIIPIPCSIQGMVIIWQLKGDFSLTVTQQSDFIVVQEQFPK